MCYKCCFKSYLTAPRLAYTPVLSQAALTSNVLCFSAPKTTSLHNIHSSLCATVTYSLFQGLLKPKGKVKRMMVSQRHFDLQLTGRN